MKTKTYEKRQLVPEVYSEPSQTAKMLLLAKIVNGFQPLAVLAKAQMYYWVLNTPLNATYVVKNNVKVGKLTVSYLWFT